MHRVLGILEIIREVFKLLDPGSNSRNARVCKAWHEAALDATWAVAGPDIFRSLTPMVGCTGRMKDARYWVFTRSITVKDWQRFLLNSPRVREWVEYPSGPRHVIAPDSIRDICITRTVLSIFPNLVKITGNSATLEPLLMGPSVQELCLTVLPSNGHRNLIVFENIRDRMPQIQFLDLIYTANTGSHDKALVDLLQNLPQLREVCLPARFFDASVAQALSYHRNLKSIACDMKTPYPAQSGNPRELVQPDHPLCPKAFPSLKEIQLSSPDLISTTKFLFQPGFRPWDLTFLSIQSSVPPSGVLDKFVAALARECNSLKTLDISLHRLTYAGVEHFGDASRLEFQDIRCVVNFKQLTSFSICHPFSVEVTDEDVAQLASLWPHLVSLSLNPRPIVPDSPRLTLRSLNALTSMCPNIEEIGLYLRVDQSLIPHPLDPPAVAPMSDVLLCLSSSPLAMDGDARWNMYPTLARYIASLPVKSCRWSWSTEESTYSPKLLNKDDWIEELAEHGETEDYEDEWRVVAAMTNLIFRDRHGLL